MDRTVSVPLSDPTRRRVITGFMAERWRAPGRSIARTDRPVRET